MIVVAGRGGASSPRPDPAAFAGRRRAIRVLASMAAAPFLPLSPAGADGGAAAPPVVTWRGTALGADAAITFQHAEPKEEAAAIRACLAEVERLEAEFSLYRPGSALVRLNREGGLDRPSLDFRVVLGRAAEVWAASEGNFDVTVQPLWELHARHFARHPGDGAGPPAATIAAARRLIGQERIETGGGRVRLAPGMAITFNGIAQGYITDRIALLLRDRGWRQVLVAMGETRALDDHPGGRPWRIDPGDGGPPLALADRAVATSAGSATRFEPTGRHHHLFSPMTGGSAGELAQVTVLAPEAVLADALATALSVMPPTARAGCLARFPGCEALLVGRDGSRVHLGAT